ncbi:MAG TPA: hypothetical protein VHO46_14600 [Bacteroidales bacterium]|nr:hypothetical protein [Bacteroidales bacterium]
MRSFTLNIAGYTIKFVSSEFVLEPGKRFESFITQTGSPAFVYWGSDLFIRVFSGSFPLPPDAIKVFQAPYVEETNGTKLTKASEFWSVWKYNDDLFIKAIFPETSKLRSAMLKFALNSKDWDLWVDSDENSIDPFEYPLDGLILYYLTVISHDIMIHASGVNYNGKGFLFSGASGKGKTTMSHLWGNNGANIIHDDRLIIRNDGEGFRMYNTPVYDNEKPSDALIDRIYLIGHGNENRSVQVSGAAAVSLVMANCIQHNWGEVTIIGLMDSLTLLCSKVPVYKLDFIPDHSVINYILNHE